MDLSTLSQSPPLKTKVAKECKLNNLFLTMKKDEDFECENLITDEGDEATEMIQPRVYQTGLKKASMYSVRKLG